MVTHVCAELAELQGNEIEIEIEISLAISTTYNILT